jgi:hypothetical protein
VSAPESLRPPLHRVVILGASNVARGIGTIVDVARHVLGGPVEILAAMGHGRSYGMTSAIPLRALPSIRECGLWRALSERPAAPTWSILTDVGNDLIYGRHAAEVAEWIDDCARRLRPLSDAMAITSLPLESVQGVGLLRFVFFRSLLFPRSALQLEAARSFAIELDERVRELARAHDAALIVPMRDWYGLDPIHIRFPVQRQAWMKIFSALSRKDFSSHSHARCSWREWQRVMTMRAERSLVLGKWRSCAQPSVMLRDGSSVSFY